VTALVAGFAAGWTVDRIGGRNTLLLGLLLQAAAYLAGLSAITLLQESLMGAPIDPVAIIPGFVVGAIGFAFVGLFVRGAHSPDGVRHAALTFA